MTVDPMHELAVRRLHDRYAAACDADSAVAVSELFAPDGVLVVRDREYVGDAIHAFYDGRLDVPSLHLTTGLVVTDPGNGPLEATCGFVAIEMHAEGWRHVVGRYLDRVRIVDGDGTFVRREIVLVGRSGS